MRVGLKASCLPINGDSDSFLIPITKDEVSVFAAEKIKITRELNIHFAIIDNIANTPFFPPFERLEAVSLLGGTQRFLGQMGQR